jgi:hypothetical protein
MITSSQINALTDEELGYLANCCNAEWNSLNMGYPFQLHFMKFFRNDAINHILNKYSNSLKDEYRGIVNEIINKLEQNK